MSDTFSHAVLKQLSTDIQQLCKDTGVSLTDIAMMTNLSMGVIKDIEQGLNFSYNSYRRLLNFYGKKPEVKIVDKV